MPRWLYSLLLYLVLPAATVAFLWRAWRSPAYRGSLRERMALGLQARTDHPLWLHAASVGELRALSALLHAMADVTGPVLVTIGTPTGVNRAREMFAADKRITVMAAPWDLRGAVRRFMVAMQPRQAAFVETELWPNLIAAARTRSIPITLASARLSQRSLQRYRQWAPALMRATVRTFGAIGAQSTADRERFIALGADPASVTVTGNLKFDVPLDAGLRQRGAALRQRWAHQRPLWVAGSTYAGEEATLIEAQRQLLAVASQRGEPAPLLALAPRRPERFTVVAQWLAEQGLRYDCTAPEHHPADAAIEVLLVNQMGVLQDWYAASDAAFVGGSLVPVGGHNLLEPAALGLPLLTGPHVFNAPEVARSLIEAHAACMVATAEQVAALLGTWLRDADAADRVGDAAAAVVAAHRGAAQRARELLAECSLTAPARSGSVPSASG